VTQAEEMGEGSSRQVVQRYMNMYASERAGQWRRGPWVSELSEERGEASVEMEGVRGEGGVGGEMWGLGGMCPVEKFVTMRSAVVT
jgi:hypothetical protein